MASHVNGTPVPYVPQPAPLPSDPDDDASLMVLGDHDAFSFRYFGSIPATELRRLAIVSIQHVFRNHGMDPDYYPKTVRSSITLAVRTNLIDADDMREWPHCCQLLKHLGKLQTKVDETQHDFCLSAPQLIVWCCATEIRQMNKSNIGLVSKMMEMHRMKERLPTAIVHFERTGSREVFPIVVPRRLSY